MILILLILATLLGFKTSNSANAQPEPSTTVNFIPSSLTIEPGQIFTLAVVVEDVVDLVGIDIQFSWNTTRLAFINHTLTVPIETYPNPMPPSPYAGILHDSPYILEDEVNVTAGTYRCAAADLGLNGFTGDGTVTAITLRALDKLGSTYLQFSNHELADPEGEPIPNNAADGVVNVWNIDVSVISPVNETYSLNSVPLTFSLSKPASQVEYSLDGQANVTITGNTTLSELSDGPHSLVVYARDLSGNIGASSMLHFSIEQEHIGPELFPVELVVAVLIMSGATAAGLVYYIRLRKKKEARQPKQS
jgi:hypothetical protein